MDLKTIGLTAAIISALGLGGAIGNYIPDKDLEQATFDQMKAEECYGKYIQYEKEGSYYCATLAQSNDDWSREEEKFKKNETTPVDYVYLDMVARNDKDKRKALEKDLIAKYDTKKHEFIGADMGDDFQLQLQFAATLADIECDKSCVMVGDTMTEKIFNLLNKK